LAQRRRGFAFAFASVDQNHRLFLLVHAPILADLLVIDKFSKVVYNGYKIADLTKGLKR
jgi:hypothetical protein